MPQRPYSRIEEADEADEDSESKVRVATGYKKVSFNPNLQSQRTEGIIEVDADNSSGTQELKSSFKQKPSVPSQDMKKDSFTSLGSGQKKQARLSMSMHEIELHKRSAEQKALINDKHNSKATNRELLQTLPNEDKGVQHLSVGTPANSGGVKSSNHDGQSFYTATERSGGPSPASECKRTDSEFLSALESNTPYQIMPDKPKNKLIQQSRPGSRSYSEGSQQLKQQGHNSETVPKDDMIYETGSEHIGDNCSEKDLDRYRSQSRLSDTIREKAQQILATYNQRLAKVGHSEFQIRLNIFFSFVKPTSVEAEPYDYLQSVEGSVMNRSDSDISERMLDRTPSNFSERSRSVSHFSD